MWEVDIQVTVSLSVGFKLGNISICLGLCEGVYRNPGLNEIGSTILIEGI